MIAVRVYYSYQTESPESVGGVTDVGSEMDPRSFESPGVYVIAGPNGAGKTTFASKFLPDFIVCREFLNADLSVARVVNRVRQGGHNVPEVDIRRRFDSGLRNLFDLYCPLADAWWLYDASRLPPAMIARTEDKQLHRVQSDLFDQIVRSTKGES